MFGVYNIDLITAYVYKLYFSSWKYKNVHIEIDFIAFTWNILSFGNNNLPTKMNNTLNFLL